MVGVRDIEPGIQVLLYQPVVKNTQLGVLSVKIQFWRMNSLFQTDSIFFTGEASLVINHYRNCRYCWPMDCGCF